MYLGQSEIYTLMEMLREDFPTCEQYAKYQKKKQIIEKKSKKLSTMEEDKNILPEVDLSE